MAKRAIIMGILLILVLSAFGGKEFYSMGMHGNAICNFCHVDCDLLPLDVDGEGRTITWQIVCPICGRRTKILNDEAKFMIETADEYRTDDRPFDPKSTCDHENHAPSMEVGDSPFETRSESPEITPDDHPDVKGREMFCAHCGRKLAEDMLFWYEPREHLLSRRPPLRDASEWVPICRTCAVKYFYAEESEALDTDRSGIPKP